MTGAEGMSRAMILYVDNDESFLQTRAEYLERAGYQVIPATTIDEARQAFETRPLDLAILDVRMVDDNDEKDLSGILLAKEERYAPIPKIILTDYPDYRTAREALGSVLDGMPVAVDYLDKKEGPQAMVERVRELLTQFTPPMPRVRWTEGLSWAGLVGLLDPELDRHVETRIWELKRLLGRCFPHARQVVLGPRYMHRVGYVCLAYEEIRADRGRTRGVVVCAGREEGEREGDRYEQFAPGDPDPGQLFREQMRRSVHYVMAVYRPIGAQRDALRPLRTAMSWLSPQNVAQVVERLFTTTLSGWHAQGRHRTEMADPVTFFLGPENAPHELRARITALDQALDHAGLGRLVLEGAELLLREPDGRSARLPLPWEAWQRKAFRPLDEMLVAHIHGQVDLDRVVVDRQGQTWLLDFTQARADFVVLDYIHLEGAIRGLLTDLTLVERVDFESDLQVLAETQVENGIDLELTWEEEVEEAEDEVLPSPPSPSWEQSLAGILAVRRACRHRLGLDLQGYLTVLYGDTLGRLWRYDPEALYTTDELLAFAHHVVLLALTGQALSSQIQTEASPEEALQQSLWLDAATRQLWVLGRPVALTPQEYTLLDHLLQRSGQVCTPEELTFLLEGEDYEYDKSVDEHRIRSAINRLRRKIEPDPANPRFLLTVRGHGYRLVTE